MAPKNQVSNSSPDEPPSNRKNPLSSDVYSEAENRPEAVNTHKHHNDNSSLKNPPPQTKRRLPTCANKAISSTTETTTNLPATKRRKQTEVTSEKEASANTTTCTANAHPTLSEKEHLHVPAATATPTATAATTPQVEVVVAAVPPNPAPTKQRPVIRRRNSCLNNQKAKRKGPFNALKTRSNGKQPALPQPPEPEPPLPYALEDLPEELRKLERPKTPFSPISRTKPGERLAVKKTILSAYDLECSIHTLESVLPQTLDCATAHASLLELIESQKRKRDVILYLFEEEKLMILERNLRQLVQFKIQHGHLDIVTGGDSKDRLAKFVAQWRSRYNKTRQDETKNNHTDKNEKGTNERPWAQAYNVRAMQEENFKILQDFGFLWKSPKKAFDWEDCFLKLKAYKEREGHCKVPQLYRDNDDGYTLGLWVSTQRKEYEIWCCREITVKKTPMNVDRIRKLEGLGFVWKLRYGRPKKSDKKFRNKRLGIGYDNDTTTESVTIDDTNDNTTDNNNITDQKAIENQTAQEILKLKMTTRI
jgi:hypothetical protein